MSPLLRGTKNIRRNVETLMTERIQSPARKKAIATIAKKNNISRSDARFRQSVAIAQSQARKK